MVGLDGLRGLAIIGVILYHINFNWMPGGFLGVTVFFVLSGYLITDILVTEWNENGNINLKKFWLRRARRLLPGMFVMLVIILAWITLFHSSLLEKMRGDSLAAMFYYSNWWYIYHKVSYFDNFAQPSPLNHFWSLAIEEQFYVFWPFLISLGFYYIKKRAHMMVMMLIGACISAVTMAVLYEPGIDPSRVYYGTDTRSFSLLFGAALALIWPSNQLKDKVIPTVRIGLDLIGGIALITILIMFWKTNQFDPFLYRGGMILLSVATALLVANLAHPVSRISIFLRFRPLRWIGVRSYGIYLWHYPIITLTNAQTDTGEFQLTRAIFQILLIFFIAQLSWKYIENPIRQGTLKNIRLQNVKVKNLTLSTKLILVCVLCISMVATLGLTTTSQAKGNNKNNATELKKTEKTEQSKEDKKPEQIASKKEVIQTQKENKADIVKPAEPLTITAIGDSIMLDVEPYLKNIYPDIKVDAQIGRQMSKAIAVVEELKKEGKLGNHVIIGLGTNGAFTKEQLDSLIQLIGIEKKVFLINIRVPRPWESLVNERLEEVKSKYPNVTLIDWYSASQGYKEYFEPDHIHLKKAGAEAYTSLIMSKINQTN
ncbi:hypothetical protein IKE_05738 [Bacillus cereus VD196]|uniref:Acyltransferase 3 domain-containing protein n=1 Tax=Bacillus cereus VD196 TaxID=1053243 RepID=A0A9W5V621_BACCE|nr:acyltransferase family protein [Bacillus cereus]EJR91166.1 hypothetical protein IKG_05803 [Bacillus cereus VD200]EOO62078.1 hypothetical protein IKE_05738 [Bacillus cereus VD196]